MSRETIPERVEIPTYLASAAIGVTIATVQAIHLGEGKPPLQQWLGGALLVIVGGFGYAVLAALPVFFIFMIVVLVRDSLARRRTPHVEDPNR